MDSRVGVDKVAQLTNFEGKGSLLERLLHLAWSEVTKVSTVLSRAALAESTCQLGEVLTVHNGLSDLLNGLDSFLLGSGNLLVSQSIKWVARSSVLLKDVAASDWSREVNELNLEFESGVWWDDSSSSS